MTPRQVVDLITGDTTPSLEQVIRRDRAGDPIDEMRIWDVRQGLRELRAAIEAAERRLS